MKPSRIVTAVVATFLVLALGVLPGCASKEKNKTKPASSGKVVSTSVKQNVETPKFGEMSFVLERVAKQEGCHSMRGAELIRDDGAVERYKISCDDGKTAYAYCEYRQCRLSQWQ